MHLAIFGAKIRQLAAGYPVEESHVSTSHSHCGRRTESPGEFQDWIGTERHIVSFAASGKEALASCEDRSFDVVLLDIRMPEMDGLETLKRLKQNRPEQAVLMLTAHGSLESAVEAGRLGAFDYVEKPSTPEAVDLRIRKAIENISLSEENKLLKTQLKEKYRFEGLVGNSPPMQEVYELMERISTTESTVLVTGGTGKELVARALHYNGPRADHRFYALHCAAIPGLGIYLS
jgi:DNA-binding NtrC family response regulator